MRDSGSAGPSGRGWMVVIATAAVVVLILAALLALVTETDFADVLRDPVQVGGVGPLVGAVSNLGVLLWFVSASVALFAGYLLRDVGDGNEARRFLVVIGLISVYLGLDDLFLFHEQVLNSITPLPQPAVVLLTVAFVGLGLLWVRRYLFGTELGLLIVAALFLGGSMTIDMAADFVEYFALFEVPDFEGYLEDSLKWLGLVAWATYVVRSSLAAVRPRLGATPPADPV